MTQSPSEFYAGDASFKYGQAWMMVHFFMEANVEIDLTAIDMLEDLRIELDAHGIVLAFARVKHDLAVFLDRAGLTQRIGEDRFYPTLPTAVAAFHHRDDG